MKNFVFAALSLALVSSSFAQGVSAGPPQRQPPGSPAADSGEQIARLNGFVKECIRVRDQLSNEAMQQVGDADADHERLEGKLNTEIAHSQALQRLFDDLKAKYEPAKKPDAKPVDPAPPALASPVK